MIRGILLIGVCCAGLLKAQVCDTGPSLWTTVRSVLVPSSLCRYYELRRFTTSLPKLTGDNIQTHVQRADAIYDEALLLAEGDVAEALLLSAAVTLPYKTFPAVLPLFRWVVHVPVSTESDACFQKRRRNLPAMMLPDSRGEEDRDKYTHFFGSAFLHLHLKNRWLVEILGESVELGEEMFKLDGALDERDLQANALGIAFAEELMTDEDARPSSVLDRTSHVRQSHESTDSPRCR